MILIEPKIINGRNDGPVRELTEEEKPTVTSKGFNGKYVFYQGDEPERVESLEDLKLNINSKIDEQTQENIFKGFPFGQFTFSMSLTAQINWSNLNFIPESMFPLSIMSKDDKEYSLSFANRPLFYGAALVYKNTCLQAGNARKTAINNSTTIKELKDLANSYGFPY